LLFNRTELARIARGEITLAFRRWRRPTVKAGGRLRTAAGELTILEVTPIVLEAITSTHANAAGFADAEMARAALRRGGGQLYRIGFRFSGTDPRVLLAGEASLDADTIEAISAALLALDQSTRTGGWTDLCLRLIRDYPGEPAARLASRAGILTPVFKRRVRQLRELGLTESLSTGYRLSPRGLAFMHQEKVSR
jgi:hypothetical protein